ncbi:MAG: ABC transporter ATP-binding protein [Spirochaetales bacterium]
MLKLWKNLKPYKWALIFVIIIIAVKSYADLLIPDLLKEVVNLIPTTYGVPAPVADMIAKGAIALLAVFAVVIAEIVISYFSSHIAFNFGKDIRLKLYEKVQNLSQAELNKVGTASLITRTMNDINQVQQVTMIIIRMMISAPIMLVGGALMAFQLDANITLIILGALPILIAMIGFVGFKIVPLYKKMQKQLDELTLVAKENITGVRVIRAFNNEKIEEAKFDDKNKAVTELATTANRYMSVTMPTVSFIFSVVTLLIIWLGAQGATDFANINAIMQYSMRIMMSFIMLVMMFIFVPRASASATRINEVMALESKIKNPTNAVKPGEDKKGLLEFKNVTFKFEGAEEPAIKNISFKSQAGKTTAIIGGTGSGKSTILNLLPRFYDVTEGAILVDGVNIKDYDLNDLRNKIAIVPQKATLFNRTIKDNIKYGNEDASDEEVIEACKIAQADDFITSEKGGYDYLIEKGGANLSGGQKQRLSIARAIVKNPEIYLFDDCFSALDLKTDSKLRKALKTKTTNANVLIVAQRISTIKDADQIMVLDEGNMVGVGTHNELLTSCEAYKEIYNSQTKKEVK